VFLQKLEVHGFKSFVDRTEIRFGPGITVIVGPNGCGKTNITDAIRWVLGEQSAKQLRGETMEDVIFGGSLRRKPVGMAEVSLVLLNERGTLPTEYSEVQIGRRVYRSGASEYTLNKTPVRLRDVRDLFYGTGMGSHAYSVIERAMVDQVLSDSSGHRRFLFEEASGITKYKQRKREALNKLDATDGDLLRVHDIVAELDRELGSLARQVARARRAGRLREQIRELDLRYSHGAHEARFERVRLLAEQQQEESVRREGVTAELARREAGLLTRKTALLDDERVLGGARAELADRETARAAAEHEAAVLGERTENLSQTLEQLAGERARLEQRLSELATREAERRSAADALRRSAAEGAAEVAERERELRAVEETLRARREVAALDKTRTLGLLQNDADRRAAFEAGRVRVTALGERHESARAIADGLRSRGGVLEGEEAALRAEIARLDAEADAARARTRAAQEARAATEAALEGAAGEETERRERLTHVRARIEALEELKSAMEGLEEGVKTLLAGRESLGIRGVVADGLDVAPSHLDAVEALLGPLLGAAVVDADADAARALDRLAQPGAGHAALVVLERARAGAAARALPADAGVRGWVRDGVSAARGFDALLDLLLEGAVLVDSAESAARLSAAHPGLRFVSEGGVVWYGGVAAGGQARDADRGLLRREQELRARARERDAAEAAFAEAGEARLALVKRRDDEARACAAADEEVATLTHARHTAEARRGMVARELETVRGEREARAAEVAALFAEATAAAEGLAVLERALEESHTETSSASRQLAGLEAELESLERSRAALASRAQETRTAWFAASQGHAEAAADLARIEAEREELRAGLTARDADAESARGRQGETSIARAATQEALEERREAERTLRERVEAALARARAARDDVEAEDRALAEQRREQMELAELVHNLELERLGVRAELERTLERLRVEYEVDLAAYAPPPLPDGETWDAGAAEQRLGELRERFRGLGPVNLLALEEYNKKKERHTFLVAQRDDLLQAKSQLLEAIEKINHTASQLFRETFAEVETHFRETFGTLFQGGECALRMIGDDPLECEIEIVARPRGKNLQSISLLSGGERALTAIALLFAIYLVKPSPFCILDEVDAPLDDANVDRFVAMLRRFSDRTQFIVVTHNKKTMEVAESLYGVTMQEPGVSKIVSVRFDRQHGEPVEEETPAQDEPMRRATPRPRPPEPPVLPEIPRFKEQRVTVRREEPDAAGGEDAAGADEGRDALPVVGEPSLAGAREGDRS
jgi:chromosome segregation protein